MPLRDHFRPPLDDMRHWEGCHATWPVMIVALLRRKLPRRFFAEPRVHSGSSAEIDVVTFENEGASGLGAGVTAHVSAAWLRASSRRGRAWHSLGARVYANGVGGHRLALIEPGSPIGERVRSGSASRDWSVCCIPCRRVDL